MLASIPGAVPPLGMLATASRMTARLRTTILAARPGHSRSAMFTTGAATVFAAAHAGPAMFTQLPFATRATGAAPVTAEITAVMAHFSMARAIAPILPKIAAVFGGFAAGFTGTWRLAQIALVVMQLTPVGADFIWPCAVAPILPVIAAIFV